ncbi:GGDEF domain-containing protein [Sneathiella glossodoripedis]|uniref:GGDEF domain-containing protein n=1 Tax=Sneathiella glossodoripedis TaxID=418853 RepID=UPI0004706587|nr:GGDEF domain-containing protein [Sneathiella glossodoripedis]
MQFLRSLLKTVTGVSSDNLTIERMGRLLTASSHSPLLTRRRALVILSRIRLLSFAAAILYLLGIFLDALNFEEEIFNKLAIYRCTAAAMMLMLMFGIRKADSLNSAHRAIFIFMGINIVFQAFFQPLVLPDYFQSITDLPTAGYAIYPFLIAACLAIFPLSIKEIFLAVVLFLTAELLIVTLATTELNPQPGLGVLISLLSACALCSYSAISQMSYMVSLVEQASVDSLTNCYSRNSGEEILDVQYRIATRQQAYLSIVFLDIDDFKIINDRYGHETGDRVLSTAASSIRHNLRDSDISIRWGGEEFVMVLPHTDADGATRAVRRLRASGLGNRPDGSPLTASIGIAELTSAQTTCWRDLVDLADAEMYKAKTAGKNDFRVYQMPKPVTSKTA